SSALSTSAFLLGLLLRTRLCSEYEALTSCSKAWKRQATPHGRSWWVLTTRERHTSESELSLWPTATASASHQGQNEPDGRRGQTLIGAARGQAWPTPTCPNGGRVIPATATFNETGTCAYMPDGKKVQVDLNHAVKNWATPAASWFERRGQTSAETWDRRMQNREADGQARFADPLHVQVERTTQGQLNPDWVEMLMGYPVGWTHIDGPAAAAKRSTTTSRPARAAKSRTEH